jgi:hypothetical protein
MKKKVKFNITIEVNDDLTVDNLIEIRNNISARLHGHNTQCPKFLKDADMVLEYDAETEVLNALIDYNKYLFHASIESDEVLNLYSGNVTTDGSGVAIVTLPDYIQRP